METRVERPGFLAFHALLRDVEFLMIIKGLASLQSERISDLAHVPVTRMYVIRNRVLWPFDKRLRREHKIHRLVASF
ncbi:hypothetical protein D4A92_19235 [Rhizobium rosettiformans]|uniref:Uncharacterized protein n=1 Tax=Rhizobium rosettiformans TaxID=1368430 RepID=A0ABX7EYP6_9HYPH|nr:MAG: hypothetical protein ABS40_13370 [Agrobacterium sp. SCN 61-19]QRF53427.1 hypothetical protein D4A92_19235 [Rhizobium rosettiformans]